MKPAFPDRFRPATLLAAFLIAAAALFAGAGICDAAPQPLGESLANVAPAQPDAALAASLLGHDAAGLTLSRQDAPVPAWRASDIAGQPLGLIGSTWELAGSTGYSGRPIDVLIAVTPDGHLAGARLMRQSEPVLTLGISPQDIADYVDGFAGIDLTGRLPQAGDPGMPDVISRATVSTGVIRDGIMRSGRILAQAQGVGQGAVDRLLWREAGWDELTQMGGFGHVTLSMAQAAEGLEGASRPLTPSDKPFIDIYAGLVDTPIMGRNLLGQRDYNAAIASLGPGQGLLAVMSSGLHSHRGTDWKRNGQFERLAVVQDQTRLQPTADDDIPVTELQIDGAPAFREISLFRVNIDPAEGGIDPRQPFAVQVRATRPAATEGQEVALTVTVPVTVPAALLTRPQVDTPLWLEFWQQKKLAVGIVAVMLAGLGLILLGQEWLVRRPMVWRRVRIGYLLVTLFVLGWGLNGQLSVVQVVAFLNALLSGFRWETFLIAPVIFLLWSAVALGMLFWGRGVFCGWLCPFGALQELLNNAAQALKIKQIAVPQALHERLWVIKYTLFVAIVALSFYSMEQALILAEVEPFKTAISMRFMRAWPFVLFVLVILAGGLFIERFYCRYLCPLGAGLAIPAKLKIFDWLKRRPQCGRECRLCETKCTVGAIDPLGRINANECVLCLRCQVIMYDPNTCPVLKRRARTAPPQPAAARPAPSTVPEVTP